MPANNLHEYILESLRPDIETQGSDYALLSILFKNYRHSSGRHTGLSLTAVGNKLMQTQFDHYTYDLDEYINKMVIIALDRNMKWPYHIAYGAVTFYSRDDAAWFTLNGSNLKDFTDVI